MTPDQRERLNDLCTRVNYERDPAKFDQYLRELDELLQLLEQKEAQIRKQLDARPADSEAD
jgi:hypothetical protein